MESTETKPKKQKRKITHIRVPVKLHNRLKAISKAQGRLLDAVNVDVIIPGINAIDDRAGQRAGAGA